MQIYTLCPSLLQYGQRRSRSTPRSPRGVLILPAAGFHRGAESAPPRCEVPLFKIIENWQENVSYMAGGGS